jgi:hypothetical protein
MVRLSGDCVVSGLWWCEAAGWVGGCEAAAFPTYPVRVQAWCARQGFLALSCSY